MNVKRVISILTAFCMCLLCAAAAPAAEAEPETASVPAEYDGFLVSVSATPPAAAKGRLAERANASLEPVFGDVYWTKDEAYAKRLLDSGLADYIEPNYIATLFDVPASGLDWPREAVRADYADTLGLDGAGVRVAVIDSGVDANNPDLREAHIVEGYDYINETTTMQDDLYHGTKVTQLICGDDNGLGVTGIAPGCELVPLRCFAPSSGGDVKTLARAIVDAAETYHCDIVNMSWGFSGNSATLLQAIRTADAAGCVLVAACGNVSTSYSQYSVLYPAAYDEVISVASVDQTLNSASTSMKNSYVTVCAPGKDITFTAADGTAQTGSGTSFASPCVAAALALVKQYAPALSGGDCMELLRTRAVDLGETGYDITYGYGLLRMDLLLADHSARLEAGSGDSSDRFFASVLRPEGGAVVVACYDSQGRMCSAYSSRWQQYFSAASLELPAEAVRCSAFFLSSDGTPLYEAASLNLSGSAQP